MITALWFIALITPLLLVHELGHFLTAKFFGVEVQEFAMGFPPRLLSFRWGGTRYSLNLLPFGAYVKMGGEDDPTAPRNLASKSPGARAVILAAGAFNNVLLAVLLFAVVALVPRTVQAGDVHVTSVFPNSPAATAGFLPGDIVRRVNGQTIENSGNLSYQLRLRMGADAKVNLERDGKPIETRVIPRWRPPTGEGATGITIRTTDVHAVTRSESIFAAIPSGVRRTVQTLILVKNEITEWFLGTASPSITGPVGVAQLTGEVAGLGFIALLELAALISLNLGIMNILPFPAFDGGRLLFVAIEVIRGKPVPPKKEALVHTAGFVLLLTSMVIISYFDIMRIFHGGSLLGN